MAKMYYEQDCDLNVLSGKKIAIIGEEEKTDAIMNLVEKNGILEMVRTGVIALERGAFTLNEDTKVRGEFNYGKNVR